MSALTSAIRAGMRSHLLAGGVSAVFTATATGVQAQFCVVDSGGQSNVLSNNGEEIMSVERLVHAFVSEFPSTPTINDTIVIDGTTFYIIHRRILNSETYEIGLSREAAHGHG